MNDFTGEFIGTFILILLGNGVVANVVLNNTKGNNAGWLVITVGWGLAVYLGVLTSTQFSEAHLNPAVTIGLAVAGTFPISKIGIYFLGQTLGAMLGAAVVWLVYIDHMKITEDPDAKLGVFCTGPAIKNNLNNLFSEIIGTFVLVFGVLYIAAPEIVSSDFSDVELGLGSVGALPVALIVFSIGLSLGGTTGYAINPARDLMPRIMHAILPIDGKRDSNWSYAWIPVVGPLLGGILAAIIFLLL